MGSVCLRVLAVAVAGVALALPAAGAAATSTSFDGTYYGSVGVVAGGAAASAPQSQVWIAIEDGRVTGYQFPVDMRCADGSFDNSGINSASGSAPATALSGAHFSVTVGAREIGGGQTGRLTGTVTGASITGHVSERGGTYADGGGAVCTGGYAFDLHLPAPVRSPEHPVRLTLQPIVEHDGRRTSYGIGVSNVSCANDALEYIVEIRGARAVSLACEESYGLHDIPAVMALAPGHTYTVTVQAMSPDWTATGTPLTMRMSLPPAGSHAWQTSSEP